jgi:hypothetical protein
MIRGSYSVLLPLVGIVAFVTPHPAIGSPSWDVIAARFKCTQKIQQREQAGGTQFIIEYSGGAQAATRPDRLFTITLSRVPQDEAAANQHTDRAIESIAQTAAKAGAKIAEFTRSSTNHGPVAYFDYELNGERNVGVIARTGPGILAVYQLATVHAKSPSDDDRRQLRAMIGLK